VNLLARLQALAAAATTGVVWIRGGRPWLRIELVSGWVHAFAAVEPPAEAEQLAAAARTRTVSSSPLDARAFQTLLSASLAGLAGADPLEASEEPRVRLGATTPFHPTRILRELGAAELRALDIAELDGRMGAVVLSLTAPIHASALDPDEHRAATLLAQHPVTLDELLTRAGAPASRVLTLLRELAALGVLVADGKIVEIDLFHLRERARAAEAEHRRNYHAAARQVHPDLHPGADEGERGKLTAEMAALAARRKKP
jgi:hypothetical protein